MEKDWVKIFSSGDLVKAEIVKSFLIDQDIQAVIINKKDFSFVVIGEAEVYVKRDDAVKAANLLKNRF